MRMRRQPIPQTQPSLLPKIIIKRKKKKEEGKASEEKKCSLVQRCVWQLCCLFFDFCEGEFIFWNASKSSKGFFSFGMQIIIEMLPTPLREYSNDTMHWSSYFHLQLSNTHRFSFMTPCEADKHCNWSFTTGETEAKFTIHDLTVTGECVQLLHKPTLGQLVNCLQMLTPAFVGWLAT